MFLSEILCNALINGVYKHNLLAMHIESEIRLKLQTNCNLRA